MQGFGGLFPPPGPWSFLFLPLISSSVLLHNGNFYQQPAKPEKGPMMLMMMTVEVMVDYPYYGVSKNALCCW